jgi:predicted metal-dependent HD superfamily phosphohydrolase
LKVTEAGIFALSRIRGFWTEEFPYHSPAHTIDVVRAADALARMEGLTEEEIGRITTAAYFHEIGMEGGYADHEQNAVECCWRELPAFSFSEDDIHYICRLILATQVGTEPVDVAEKVICDADLDYLGRDDYPEIAQKLRCEWEGMGICEYSDIDWFKYQLEFMKAHHFYTDSAKGLRSLGKEKNIQWLAAMINRTEKTNLKSKNI